MLHVEEHFCDNFGFDFRKKNNFQLRAKDKKMYREKELSQRLIVVENVYISIPAIYHYKCKILTLYVVPLITQ